MNQSQYTLQKNDNQDPEKKFFFSVILCVYNGEKTIEFAIKSVLDQTFTNFELIIVNDGSRDNSICTVKKYQQSDSRIVILSHKNKGAGFSRNAGIKKSRGKWITFIDADDMWDTAKLEKQYETIQTVQNAGIVVTENASLQSKTLSKKKGKTEYIIIDDMLTTLITRDFNFAPASAAVKAELFDHAQYTYDKSGQDYYPFLIFALMQCVFVKITNPLYYVRTNPNTLSRSQNSRHLGAKARVKAIRRVLEEKQAILKLDSGKIQVLKSGHDRFLRWAISGARQYKPFNDYFTMTLDAKKNFYNQKYFYIELFKTILFPLKKWVNK